MDPGLRRDDGVVAGGMMGIRPTRKRRAPMAEINVTPMVDVMLVLLIIFMVTAPLLMAGVPVNLPDANAKPLDQDSNPLQVSIDAGGRVFVGDVMTPAAALDRTLAGASGRQVLLRADRGLDYGRVMRLMGALQRAGLTRVALVTTGTER